MCAGDAAGGTGLNTPLGPAKVRLFADVQRKRSRVLVNYAPDGRRVRLYSLNERLHWVEVDGFTAFEVLNPQSFLFCWYWNAAQQGLLKQSARHSPSERRLADENPPAFIA